ncbi:MAG: CDGSH iron-sulfur domain-containing protein [Bacteroidota bacterium]
MDLPKVAGNQPIGVELEAGKTYAWCACGLSTNQPFCDGAHKGSDLSPIVFKAEESKKVFFCTCKKTDNNWFCDGAHKNL